MRILLLSQFFTPEPMPRNLAFTKALQAQGHDVRVLTGFPNYPGGKIYPGYRQRFVQHEVMDSIRITRVPLYNDHSRRSLRRIANYVSFMASATLAGLFSRWRPDVIYVYHPPLTVGIAAGIIGFLRGVPFVYDIQDLWPDALAAPGMVMNPRMLSTIERVAAFVYRWAAHLLPQSPGFAPRLRATGVPDDKITVLYNWADEAAIDAAPAWQRPAALHGKFMVTFAGNMGVPQALDSVLDAAALLKTTQPDVAFFFIGSGTETERLQRRVETEGLTNCVFHPSVPSSAIGGVLKASDALLVNLRDDPLYTITIPSKTQTYLYVGKPILMGVRGDAAVLVEGANAGVAFRQEDPQALAAAVQQLLALSPTEREAMGQRGRAFYDRELSFAAGVNKVLDVLRRVSKVA